MWLTSLILASLVLVVVGFATSARRDSDSAKHQSLANAHVPGGPWLGVTRLKGLASPVQDPAAAAVKGGALVLGGLDSSQSSVPTIQLVGASGSRGLGSLQTPLHDAAAARLGSKVYLFGGGQTVSYAAITAVDPSSGSTQSAGQLPEPRSDLAAATINGTAYLVGGFTGTAPQATILAFTPPTGTQAAAARPQVVAHMPQPLRYAAVAAAGGRVVIAGGISPSGPTSQILVFDPTTQRVSKLGTLPAPLSHAPAVALGRFVYVLGGRAANGVPTKEVFAIDSQTGTVSVAGHLPEPLSDAAAVPFAGGILTAGGRSGSGPVSDVFQLRPAPRPASMATTSLLRPGSDPSVLPSNVLIADKANNRLLVVTPQGNVAWSFPKPGQLAHGQTFKLPDDAFFAPNGKQIVATEEDDQVISVVDMARGRIVYRYGHPGVPGLSTGYVHNPDDAIMLNNGRIISADIKNCRLIELQPPLHHTIAHLGSTGLCGHTPPSLFGSPNGAFPLRDGGIVVTEINGDWIDVFNRSGRLVRSFNAPGFTYPSDTNEVHPGLYLTVDYVQPGAVMKINDHGQVLWTYRPGGKQALNHPSLALPLPNGDVLLNDDHNHRVIVIDPRTNRVVWQYGHTGVPGRKPGYLNTPDGVDLAPPHALIDSFGAVRGLPGH